MDWKLLDEFKKSKKLWSTAALGCAEDAASMSQIVIELDVSRVIRSPLIRLHEQRYRFVHPQIFWNQMNLDSYY